MALNTFIYDNQVYIRCIPAKSLFKSSLVHEVVNRGDIFAVRISDQVLTIIPGKSQVEHTSHELSIPTVNKTPAASSTSKAEARAKLKQLAADIKADKLRQLAAEQAKQRALFGNL